MRSVLLSALAGAGICLLTAGAEAQVIHFEVTNLTLSGGDPTFPVTNDVTFTGLNLQEHFNDGTTGTVDLKIPNDGTVVTSLDTSTILLESDPFDFPTPHGGLQFATLTGSFSVTNWTLQNTFGGPSLNATVSSTFSATLSGPGGFTYIDGTDALNGGKYHAGTLALTATPEPGAFAFGLTGLLGIASLARNRFRRHRKETAL